MTKFPKDKTVDTTHPQPGKIIHMDFAFYNFTSIRGFTSILNFICENARMIWVFTNAYKWAHVRIIRFVLVTLNNEYHPWKRLRVDEDGALEKSTYVTNLLFYDFRITMETTGGDASWLNGNNERHNRIIHNVVREGLIYSNKHKKNVALQHKY